VSTVLEVRCAKCADEGRKSNLLAAVVSVDGALCWRPRGSLRASSQGRASGVPGGSIPNPLADTPLNLDDDDRGFPVFCSRPGHTTIAVFAPEVRRALKTNQRVVLV
jgi:hypothetical protein